MKTIKSLIAASILAAAGIANAAVIDVYNVNVYGTTTGAASGYLSGSGTATFDDAGILTIDYTAFNNQPAAGGTFYTTVHAVYTGSILGNQFTNTGGTMTITNCSAGSIACPAQIDVTVGVPDTLEPTVTSGSGGGLLEQAFTINFDGGVYTSTIKQFSGILTNSLTYDIYGSVSACTGPTEPGCGAPTPHIEMPIPTTAWLFGSGLGLTGFARRRRTI